MAESAREAIQADVERYAKKYGRPADLGYGFEAYVAHLFSGDEGFGSDLDDHWNEDLSDRILSANDRGIDVVLRDETNQRLMLVQCKYSPRKPPSDAGLYQLVAAHDYLQDAAYLSDASAAVQEKLGDYGLCVEDGWFIELRFVTAADVPNDSGLHRAAESANRTFRKEGQNVVVSVLGRRELRETASDLRRARAGLLPEVTFSVRKGALFEISGADERHALVARVSANELMNLYRAFGAQLFAFNIRLPLSVSRPTLINDRMRETAESVDTRSDFFFFNNGVSAVCDDFTIEENTVHASRFQIINGAQTVDALKRAAELRSVHVLFRLTATSEPTGGPFTENVIRYNNTQNPIADSDFRANDAIQSFLHEEFGKKFSGKGALRGHSFTYVAKRGQRSTQKSKALRLEEFAKLRHAFLYGPTVSFKKPKDLWEVGNKYEEAFGENGKLVPAWSEETLCEAACAYEIWLRVLTVAEQLKGQKDADGAPLMEGRYLKRLSRYVVALTGAGLREWHASAGGFATWEDLVGSQSEFDRYVEPLLLESRKALLKAFRDRLNSRREVQPEYNLARDEREWENLRDGIVQEIGSGLIQPR